MVSIVRMQMHGYLSCTDRGFSAVQYLCFDDLLLFVLPIVMILFHRFALSFSTLQLTII